uniref:Wiskott-Aldrich syndrome protein family member n=1 Tax=Crassostrea virginica TaxID=6565 RepID=A0A8B8AKX1_CRAVI|nr:wiskott-Aldrich syndrome protein family member 2-like [Crassostrea virginica]XP_022291835.1 wiskott-Aldrich syndrome protein family member 2-like [Crassostrea virginica]
MPFIQRWVEPINVSRVGIEKGIANELECVTNHTLSNIILQLSSLSKHAEDMFTELSQEVETFTNRSRHLLGRITKLHKRVKRLDSTRELVSVHDINLRKPYKSSTQYDQQVVSRCTMPRAMLKTYGHCNPIPALDKLNPYREDGKDSVKFYTYPGFFFELWVQGIEKEMNKWKTGTRRPATVIKPTKTPSKVENKVEKNKYKKVGEEYIDCAATVKLSKKENQPPPKNLDTSPRQPESVPCEKYYVKTKTAKDPQNVSNHTNNVSKTHAIKNENNQHHSMTMTNQNRLSLRKQHEKPLDPPPKPPKRKQNGPRNSLCRNSLPPPPAPPPPPSETSDGNLQPSSTSTSLNPNLKPRFSSSIETSKNSPLVQRPPPPPTPPPQPPQPPPPPPPPISPPLSPILKDTNEKISSSYQGSLLGALANMPKLKPTTKQKSHVDSRSQLLEQIRLHQWSKTLRKVKMTERSNKSTFVSHDIHSIMNKAFEMSRIMKEESEDDIGSSEDEWE